jgi:hypothetical protein
MLAGAGERHEPGKFRTGADLAAELGMGGAPVGLNHADGRRAEVATLGRTEGQ